MINNNQYIKAYKNTEKSVNSVTSPHEIIRTLMKELTNSMTKIVLDIQDERNDAHNTSLSNVEIKKNKALKKSKNVSKSLSIIYGLQTCLDFDKAFDIASNLFQLYEYCKQEILKGFTRKIEDGIIKAIDIVKQIMEGWEEIPSLEKTL